MLCNARKRTQDTYREREGGLPRYIWIRALSTQQGGYVRATNLIIIIKVQFCHCKKYAEIYHFCPTEAVRICLEEGQWGDVTSEPESCHSDMVSKSRDHIKRFKIYNHVKTTSMLSVIELNLRNC